MFGDIHSAAGLYQDHSAPEEAQHVFFIGTWPPAMQVLEEPWDRLGGTIRQPAHGLIGVVGNYALSIPMGQIHFL